MCQVIRNWMYSLVYSFLSAGFADGYYCNLYGTGSIYCSDGCCGSSCCTCTSFSSSERSSLIIAVIVLSSLLFIAIIVGVAFIIIYCIRRRRRPATRDVTMPTVPSQHEMRPNGFLYSPFQHYQGIQSIMALSATTPSAPPWPVDTDFGVVPRPPFV